MHDCARGDACQDCGFGGGIVAFHIGCGVALGEA